MIKAAIFLIYWGHFLPLSPLRAQSVIEKLTQSPPVIDTSTLPSEKIVKTSPSKRIFIISNSNNSFQKGDFITLVVKSRLMARALVAKTKSKEAGIKILKIYSLARWQKIKEGMPVQIIRGDDRHLTKLVQEREKGQSLDMALGGEEINDESDLFNETLIEDDLEVQENKNREIKADNFISAGLGFREGIDINGAATRYTQINVQWAHQLEDNIWGEFSYGQNTVRGYPNPGLDTTWRNFTLRIKYAVKIPFHSYALPYVGYQISRAVSPQAGIDLEGTLTQEELNRELELIEALQKKELTFGITIMRRLVPGWFLRFDLQPRMISMGFGLEF